MSIFSLNILTSAPCCVAMEGNTLRFYRGRSRTMTERNCFKLFILLCRCCGLILWIILKYLNVYLFSIIWLKWVLCLNRLSSEMNFPKCLTKLNSLRKLMDFKGKCFSYLFLTQKHFHCEFGYLR